MRFAALNPALKRRSKFRGRSASKDESGGSAEANRMESVIEFQEGSDDAKVAQRGKAPTDTAKGFNTIIGSVPHSGGVKYL